MSYKKTETYDKKTTDDLIKKYESILKKIGEDPEREGLIKTPERAAKAIQFLTHGYDLNPEEILKGAMFAEDYSEMVVVKDIEVFSLCEHHMLPFFGKAHVAYIPNGHIVGLSKIPRIVDVFARRLQVQERLTDDVLKCIQNTLRPLGAAVVIEALLARGAEHALGLCEGALCARLLALAPTASLRPAGTHRRVNQVPQRAAHTSYR